MSRILPHGPSTEALLPIQRKVSWEHGIMLGFLALELAAVLLLPTRDPDVYFHLAVGRSVIEHGGIPRTELFSYSHEGIPLAYADVVSAVFLERAFRLMGFAGFAALKLLAALAMGAGAWLTVRPCPQREVRALAAIALLLGSFALVERPALASFAGLALVWGWLERARRTESSRAFVGAALTASLWSFLHRFAILGHGLVFAFVIARYWRGNALSPRATRKQWYLELAVALAALGSVVLTPFGIRTFTSGGSMFGDAHLRARFSEWQRATPVDLLRAFPLGSLLILAAVGVVIMEIRAGGERRVRALHSGAAWLFLLGVTLATVRFMPYLIVGSVLVLCQSLAHQRMPRGTELLVTMIGLAAALARRPPEPWRLGESEAFAPSGALRFAAEHGLRGRVANAIDLGGYLIWHAWPSVRVLVDSRNEAAYPPSFILECAHAEEDPSAFEAMRARDSASWAIGTNEPGRSAFSHLARQPDWGLVYWSDAAVVWVHLPSYPELKTLRYRFIDPLQPQMSVAAALLGAPLTAERAEAVHADIARLLSSAPFSARANLALAVWLHVLGKHDERDQLLSKLGSLEQGREVAAWLANLRRLPSLRPDDRPPTRPQTYDPDRPASAAADH